MTDYERIVKLTRYLLDAAQMAHWNGEHVGDFAACRTHGCIVMREAAEQYGSAGSAPSNVGRAE